VKRIVWTDPAKSDVRKFSKPVAMQIFSALHRFAKSGVGNVKALQGGTNFVCASGTTASSLSARMPKPSRSAASVIAVKPTAEMA
jgi:hypothetical protein